MQGWSFYVFMALGNLFDGICYPTNTKRTNKFGSNYVFDNLCASVGCIHISKIAFPSYPSFCTLCSVFSSDCIFLSFFPLGFVIWDIYFAVDARKLARLFMKSRYFIIERIVLLIRPEFCLNRCNRDIRFNWPFFHGLLTVFLSEPT